MAQSRLDSFLFLHLIPRAFDPSSLLVGALVVLTGFSALALLVVLHLRRVYVRPLSYAVANLLGMVTGVLFLPGQSVRQRQRGPRPAGHPQW